MGLEPSIWGEDCTRNIGFYFVPVCRVIKLMAYGYTSVQRPPQPNTCQEIIGRLWVYHIRNHPTHPSIIYSSTYRVSYFSHSTSHLTGNRLHLGQNKQSGTENYIRMLPTHFVWNESNPSYPPCSLHIPYLLYAWSVASKRASEPWV